MEDLDEKGREAADLFLERGLSKFLKREKHVFDLLIVDISFVTII
jgi:hypothetical protein